MTIPKDLRLFLKVYWNALLFFVLLRLTGLPRLLRTLKEIRPAKNTRPISMERLWGYANFAVKHPPFCQSENPCLLRSLVVYSILKPRRADSSLVVGLNAKKQKTLQGHAWVELGSEPFFEKTEDLCEYSRVLTV